MKRLLPALLVVPFILTACGNKMQGSVTPPDDMQNTNQENAAVLELHEGDTLALPNFAVTGQVIAVDGEAVAIFEYQNEDDAAVDQGKVAGDGQSIDGSSTAWTDAVHFFRHDTVIVVYVGTNESILEKLRTDGGDQFAGN